MSYSRKLFSMGFCRMAWRGQLLQHLVFSAWLAGLFAIALSKVRACDPSSNIDFETHIAPIFIEHCLKCHSEITPKGDLSLASPADLQNNSLIVVGAPDESLLIEMVTGTASHPPQMPVDGQPLAEFQVDLLRRWIMTGASWPADITLHEKPKADNTWWSLQPLQRNLLDATDGTSSSNVQLETDSPLDRFVAERLAEAGLGRSPRADKRTLIRRLSYDLHGLPPSPEAVEAFVNDNDPLAYEKLVDRLIESPLYGERLAQHWLDISHYADTHGFERDMRRRNAWRYRDYVIAAFNEDKPYDRFLQEQIAGDILWPNNADAVIATGFLAAGPWDYVGQVEAQSELLRRTARSLDLDDMATQVMTTTLGMTIHCARCHDHKLDPITQMEYYQLRAVFAGVSRADRVVSEAEQADQRIEKDSLISRRNAIDFEIGRLARQGIDLADIVGGGHGFGGGVARQGIDVRTGAIQHSNLGALDDVKLNRFMRSESEFVDGVFVPDGENGEAPVTISSTGLTVTGLPKTSGAAWDSIRNGPVANQHSVELGGIDFTASGHTLLGLHANAGITFDLVAIREASGLQDLRFEASVGYFGASGENLADAWIFIDGVQMAAVRNLHRDLGLQKIEVPISNDAQFLTLVSTDGGNGYAHDQIGFGDPTLRPAALLASEVENDLHLESLRNERRKLTDKIATLEEARQVYGVVASASVPEVRLLERGDTEAPSGRSLAPSALSALAMLDPQLGTLESSAGERRAALAKWITHPANPLITRVIVNRLWQWHFGEGIVQTSSDFGYGGGQPSHPKMLDWLAAELPRRGWSLKAIHRLILTSETYRQQSQFTSSSLGLQIDANNQLLWRQNARRVDAESIRDSVLFAAGNLNLQASGPGFDDFRYEEAYAPVYTYFTANEPALWRRSIYRTIVRTTPNRFLATLDCPDPANLTPKRSTTTTPLQSLALYNNEFILRQAQYLAQRVEREAGNMRDAQVRRAFELVLGRNATAAEQRLSIKLVEDHGLFALCRSLINSNEFVVVD